MGWVCGLPLEMAAARVMFDAIHPKPSQQDPADRNNYILGEVRGHNVAVACLPTGVYGITSAATVAKDMLRTFKSLRFGLLIGIGGGIPSQEHDIRLGDVVVSQPTDTHGGRARYDRGEALQGDVFQRTESSNAPPQVLLEALSRLQAEHLTKDSRIPEFLTNLPPKMKKRFGYPASSSDCLFLAEYTHAGSDSTCDRCDHTKTIHREERHNAGPVIHYGTIASGYEVIKDGKLRDEIGERLGALCFEVEAADLQCFPSILIRGVCDYADSHTNKTWHFYAAATATAFAKELLSFLPPSQVLKSQPIQQPVSSE